MAVFAATACGDDEPDRGDRSTSGTPASVGLGDITSQPDGSRATVRGNLVVEGAAPARLCDGLLESFPPQCGEPSVELVGLDVAAVGGVQDSGADPPSAGVRWTDEVIEVTGTVDAGRLLVDEQ